MIRKFKALGIASMVVFAFTAVAAQTAAAGETYTSGAGAGATTFITGEKTSNHVFSTPNGTVSCTSITFKGEAVQTGPAAHEITINPTYSGCTAFGFATAHVTNNGCHYLFTTPTEIAPGKWTIHPPHIVPTSGSSCNFQITPTTFGVSVCTQTVPNQTPTKGHIIAVNRTGSSPADVDLETTIEGIHYTGTGGVCGDGTTHSDATYTGNATVKGFSDAAHTKQIAVSIS